MRDRFFFFEDLPPLLLGASPFKFPPPRSSRASFPPCNMYKELHKPPRGWSPPPPPCAATRFIPSSPVSRDCRGILSPALLLLLADTFRPFSPPSPLIFSTARQVPSLLRGFPDALARIADAECWPLLRGADSVFFPLDGRIALLLGFFLVLNGRAFSMLFFLWLAGFPARDHVDVFPRDAFPPFRVSGNVKFPEVFFIPQDSFCSLALFSYGCSFLLRLSFSDPSFFRFGTLTKTLSPRCSSFETLN